MPDMKVVGIKDLKARLSEFVRLVKSGETVLVTERDEVVAELRPPGRRVPVGGDLEQTLDLLAASRDVSRAPDHVSGWVWRTRGLGLAEGSAARLIDELREDRH